jgi:hypothetical protein
MPLGVSQILKRSSLGRKFLDTVLAEQALACFISLADALCGLRLGDCHQ